MRPPVVQIQPEPVARLHNVALKGIVESKCEQASKRHENGGILVTKEFAVKEGTIERMEYRRADGRLVRITAILLGRVQGYTPSPIVEINKLIEPRGSGAPIRKGSANSVAPTPTRAAKAYTNPLSAYTQVTAQPAYPFSSRTTSGRLNAEQSLYHIGPPVQRIPVPIESNKDQLEQGRVRFMAFRTSTGNDIEIPVDVQAASSTTTERRGRNASASARCRARKKHNLKQQLDETLEDVERLRKERDYFKSLVLQQQYANAAPSNASSSEAGAGFTGSPYSGYNGGLEQPGTSFPVPTLPPNAPSATPPQLFSP
ncbi:hypothetical protein P154DRAFT_573264 [Amniculicola lignicola CBS 123094]|uniref:BZIP domain-containing protein n=1 Tax=Amniculicola lignicola CBS 123094 TaxID=1392246 RepID=A0A6A5WSV5_9PLEO|nr:hypothetical protein P154DRAFT_573264 [Amniculicola lignicola CBS 123094]